MDRFKIDRPYGPSRLREVHGQLVQEINKRTPIEGIGIRITEHENGFQISTETKPGPEKSGTEGTQGGGGTDGTSIDIYGAFNGDPAIFHLLQSSAPTPL